MANWNWKIGSKTPERQSRFLSPLRKENAREEREMDRTSAFQRLVAEHRPQSSSSGGVSDDEAKTHHHHHHHHHRTIGDDERIRFAKAIVTSARNALSLAKATATAIEQHQLETYFDQDIDGIADVATSSSFLDGIGGVKTRRKGTISVPSKTPKDIEAARDSIEREIVECVRECQKHVDRCEALIASGWNSSSSSSWATLKLKHAPQFVAHLHGVALIASERIEEVAKTLDAMRARRFREQAEKARRLERRRGGDERVGVEAVAKDLMRRRVVKSRTSGNVGESSNNSFSQQQQQQQQQQEFVNDSEALLAELVEISRGTQRAESKIVELSALSSMFANVVSKQSQQIERVYAEALKSTKFLEVGNVEMRKTISRRRSGSSYMAFVFFVATFAVLFLDWFND